jgi:hypothetical protein
MTDNSFPARCIAALDTELTAHCLKPIEFSLVHGKNEAYRYAAFVQRGLVIELYVYAEEAGCKLNGSEWTAFKKGDFAIDDELIEQFVAYVLCALTVGRYIKEDQLGWSNPPVRPPRGH